MPSQPRKREICCNLKGREFIALVILVYALAPLAVMKSGTAIVALQALYLGRALGAPAAAPGTKNVIIQMFEWTWNSISTECTQFIGPAGRHSHSPSQVGG